MGKFSEGLLDEGKILKQLHILPGQRILDAGCGDGYMAKKFSKRVGREGQIYALDPDRNTITRLCEELGDVTNITAFVGDITKRTKLEDASLDLIYLSTVFHIFSGTQVQGFDEEVTRLLKPQGRLAIVNINKEETPFGPPLNMRSSPEEVIETLSLEPTCCLSVADHFYLQTFVKK